MKKFIKDNLLVISLIVISILIMLVIISALEIDLNPPKKELKLVKEVVYISK
jgi:hypothetical protein